MKKLLLFFFLIPISLIAKSQTITKWDSLGKVNAIAVDKNDNVWVAWEGTSYVNGCLSKFDGNKWIYFNNANGIPLQGIRGLTVDKNGNLWCVRYDTVNNVLKYDGISWKSYSTQKKCTLYSIQNDNNGNIWIASSQSGIIYKFDKKKWTEYKLTNLLNPLYDGLISAISFDAEGNGWFGTDVGLVKFDETAWSAYSLDYQTGNKWLLHNPNYAGGMSVSEVSIDNSDVKWLASEGICAFTGVNSYDILPNNKPITFSGDNLVYTIRIDNNNIKWLGGYIDNWTIYKYNGNYFESINNSEGTLGNIEHIDIDSKGNKWIGGSGGIIRYSDGGAGPLVRKSIRGLVFDDINGNGVQDAGEPGIGNQFINVNTRISTSQSDGKWACMPIGDTALLKLQPQAYWKATTDSVISINMNTVKQDTVINFGVRPLQNTNDVAVSFSGGCTRANFKANYWIDYKNLGSNNQHGVISFIPDASTTFVSSTPAPDSTSGTTLFWKYSNLAFYNSNQIGITLQMPDVTHLGDTLRSYAHISGLLPDANTSNNADTLKQVITGSYDPNEITVSPIGETNEHDTRMNTVLTYTINFQNTGTDTAFIVAIRDTISKSLDMNTYELLASSHPVQLEVKSGNIATYRFENINLPDSAHNNAGSKGYIKYRIHPKANLSVGTLVTKRAYIYFDMNPAIVTNIAFNTYTNVVNFPSGMKSYNTIASIPNPMGDYTMLEFKNPNNSRYILTISNLQGQEIYRAENITGNMFELKRGALNNGVYILRLIPTSSGTTLVGKLVIE